MRQQAARDGRECPLGFVPSNAGASARASLFSFPDMPKVGASHGSLRRLLTQCCRTTACPPSGSMAREALSFPPLTPSTKAPHRPGAVWDYTTSISRATNSPGDAGPECQACQRVKRKMSPSRAACVRLSPGHLTRAPA